MNTDTIEESIAHRAHQLYVTRGEVHGYDSQDWFIAEEETRHPKHLSKQQKQHNKELSHDTI